MKVHSSNATVQHTHAHNRSKYDQIQPNIQLFGRKHKSHQHYLTHSFSHMLIMRHTASCVKQWSERYPIFVLWLCSKYTSDSFFFVVSVSLPHVSQQWWREGGTTWVHLHKESKKEGKTFTDEQMIELNEDINWFSSVSERHTVTVFTQFFFFQFYTLILFLFFLCASNTLINRGYWDSYMNPKQPEIKRSWEVKARLIE